MDRYSEELDVAVKAIREAADIYLASEKKEIEEKDNTVGSYDIVTDFDVKAQNSIMAAIHSRYPEDSFICEEGQENDLGHSRTWVIDPIDGTLHYERGIPLFGTQLVLMVDKEPVMSVIYLPVLKEMYTATIDSGAFLNGVSLKKCQSRDLKKCVVSTGDFSKKKAEWRDAHYEMIDGMRENVARIRMFGASCCDFAFFSAGRTDIHIRFVNKLWDFMPGLFLARMSGAYVDEELLEKTRFLLLTQSAEEASEFREKVLPYVGILKEFS